MPLYSPGPRIPEGMCRARESFKLKRTTPQFLAVSFGLLLAVGASAQQPTPVLTLLTPSERTVGTGSFLLTVTGTAFCDDASGGSFITFNGNSHTTATPTSTSASTTILASEISSPGSVSVIAMEPGNATLLTINSQVDLDQLW